MAKSQSRVEKKQPQYGSDVVVDLMKAHDIEYAAFNPGATFRGIHDSIVNYGGNYKPEVLLCRMVKEPAKMIFLMHYMLT